MVSLLIPDYLIWVAFEGDFDRSHISPCLRDVDIEARLLPSSQAEV